MEENLIADLRADAAIAAITANFNGREGVDWVSRPDTANLPAVTLQRISTDRIYSHQGPVTLTGARVQVDCWAHTYTAARGLYRAVQDKMEAGGTGWRSFLLTERDFAPDDAPGGERIFRVMGDFNIWYED